MQVTEDNRRKKSTGTSREREITCWIETGTGSAGILAAKTRVKEPFRRRPVRRVVWRGYGSLGAQGKKASKSLHSEWLPGEDKEVMWMMGLYSVIPGSDSSLDGILSLAGWVLVWRR